ncbi:ferrichrome-iron receptor [Pectobacterium araliae]|uniref:TonB-dependent siderophore receptor n=1 Tax=Pectobacterium araliae TaxID=3073862 RepID=A0AAN0KLB8_9GAMM|nr:TonB-dependent siderophore receptor [Pectobacterium sp. MAFF 302110]GKW20059.1 ferrichrome-iron receptor [Pectobacterium carotovorum subsp. carotovorum]
MKKSYDRQSGSALSLKKRLFFGRMLSINTALLLSAAVIPMTTYAAGENDTIAFSIPAGDLQKGLLAIANQSKQTISFSPGLVANYQSAALTGNYSTRQAILRLLQGTPLLLTTTDNGTLTIISSSSQDVDAAKANDKTLPAITVNAGSEDETVLNPNASSSALRTNTSLQQTAQSVSVISSKLLNDRQVTSLAEALKNAGGVITRRSNRGEANFYIRGQKVTSGLTDGVSGSSNVGIGQGTAIEGIERIEVLKGPQSVLSGSSSPAGTINLVRKKPVTEPLHRVKMEASQYGEFKTAMDLGGALTDDKAFSYRLNGSTMKSDNAFPDYNGDHADYLAPALAWKGESTRVLVGAEFSQGRNSGPAGTVHINGQIQKLPKYRLGDKDDHFKNKTTNAYYEVEQDLIGGWTFNSKANYQSTYGQLKMNETLAVDNNGYKTSHPLSTKYTNQTWSLQNDVRGVIETGPVKQTLLLGHDYKYERYASYEGNFVTLTNGNIFVPGSLSFPGIGEPTNQRYTSKLIQNGLLLQDQIDLWERTHLQLSLKHSSWDNSYLTSGKPATYSTSKWIPNYGISFDITPDVTAYANYLNSFEGSPSINLSTGKPIPPSTGKSKEVGLKFNLLEDDLTLTTALFDVRQNNIVVFSNGRQVGTEGRASKGLDIDLNGMLLPGWEVTGSYTYTKNSDPEIAPSAETPRHSVSLWSSYEIQTGVLQGAGASAGFRSESKTTENGYQGEYFKIGSQTSVDVAIFYRQPAWSLQFGVDNIFDRDLFYSTATPLYLGVQDGRTWRLTGTYSF